jgi:hypothetical protein
MSEWSAHNLLTLTFRFMLAAGAAAAYNLRGYADPDASTKTTLPPASIAPCLVLPSR